MGQYQYRDRELTNVGKNNEIVENWVNNNMFSFRKVDGAAYFIFYILIPVTITWISLATFPSDDIAAIYCYVTILVSALNCIYDAGNRWVAGTKAWRNTKLFWVMLSAGVVATYCVVVIFNMFMTKNTSCRCDCWLLVYIVAVIVAVIDIVGCFSADMAWKACVGSTELEEEIK